jgi:hypothetical protein
MAPLLVAFVREQVATRAKLWGFRRGPCDAENRLVVNKGHNYIP